jgi:hypothetical protein
MQKQRLALLAALALTACPAPSTEEELVMALEQRSAGPASKTGPARGRKLHPLPQGLTMMVLPGQGVGPIRIGARLAHIERLMQARCEVQSEDLCPYPSYKP